MESAAGNPLQALAILSALLAIVPAILLERRRKRRLVGVHPYAWAYFQGVAALIFGMYLCFLASVAAATSADTQGGAVVGVVIAGLYAIPGWYVIRRARWAWVTLTVLSLNPLLWIINYIYGKTRWNELGSAPFRDTIRNAEPTAAGVAERLEALATLRSQNTISEEEFVRRKADLLNASDRATS